MPAKAHLADCLEPSGQLGTIARFHTYQTDTLSGIVRSAHGTTGRPCTSYLDQTSFSMGAQADTPIQTLCVARPSSSSTLYRVYSRLVWRAAQRLGIYWILRVCKNRRFPSKAPAGVS